MYIYTVSENVVYQLLLAILPVFRLHTCKSLQACSHCQGSVSAVVAFACDSWSSPWIFALNASAPYSPGFREGWTASKKTSGWCLILLPQTSTSCFESNKANKQFGRQLIEFTKVQPRFQKTLACLSHPHIAGKGCQSLMEHMPHSFKHSPKDHKHLG